MSAHPHIHTRTYYISIMRAGPLGSTQTSRAYAASPPSIARVSSYTTADVGLRSPHPRIVPARAVSMAFDKTDARTTYNSDNTVLRVHIYTYIREPALHAVRATLSVYRFTTCVCVCVITLREQQLLNLSGHIVLRYIYAACNGRSKKSISSRLPPW